jgi:hypothetical protein
MIDVWYRGLALTVRGRHDEGVRAAREGGEVVTDEDVAKVAVPAYRREGYRWPCHHGVELVHTGGRLQERWSGVVVDASSGGLGVLCEPMDVLGPGTELAVRLPDGNWASGKVRHTAAVPDGVRVGIVVTRASGQLTSLFPPADD